MGAFGTLAGELEPPYYAVIFWSQRSGIGDDDYERTAEEMAELARTQPGFLGLESVRGPDGYGVTISYWVSEAAIAAWKQNAEHLIAQRRGKSEWYERYEVQIARVERAYSSTGRRARDRRTVSSQNERH